MHPKRREEGREREKKGRERGSGQRVIEREGGRGILRGRSRCLHFHCSRAALSLGLFVCCDGES